MMRSREPPIRTFTVGCGVSPHQPFAGSGGVADYDRRFGFAPTPVHARVINSSRTLYSDLSASVVARAAMDADKSVKGDQSATPRRASQTRATSAGASVSSLSIVTEAPAQASTAASAAGASRS